jgi:hypothetical protein
MIMFHRFFMQKIIVLLILILGFFGVASFADAATAVYNATYKAPACVSSVASCDSGTLLNSRDTLSVNEPNQPNTINNSCTDGGFGATYHVRESMDRLSVATNDGTTLAGGKAVTVSATVWCYSGADRLDLYYTNSIPGSGSPVWTLIGTTACTVVDAAEIKTGSYTLPSTGTMHAVRANFRYSGSASSCSTGNYDDHDDLVFVVAAASDTTAPAAVSDFALSGATQSSINLSWTAPGDDGAVGTATSYDVRYSTALITAANFSSATQVSGEPAPQSAGTNQSMTVPGLTASTLYYFAMKTSDEVPNTSLISNVPSLSTTAPPPPSNLSGYAWGGNPDVDGIGWISMSCVNAGNCASTGNYGVSVSSANPGVLSGYAWVNPNDGAQNHIGWIDFAPSLVGAPVSANVPNQTVRLDRATGNVRGWARVVNYDVAGGWDGWIGFGGGGNYGTGVTVSGCSWNGYAWGGGTVLGWIHFAGATYGVTGSGDGCAVAVTPACSDGDDNDGDGFVDLADRGCIDASDTDESDPPPPSTPTGFDIVPASLNTCGAILLSWADVAGEDTYQIERNDGGWHLIGEPVANDLDFEDTTIAQNTSYSYRIRACNTVNSITLCSGYSGSVPGNNQSPFADLSWSPLSPRPTQSALFTDNSVPYGAGISIDSWSWAFEDGTPSVSSSASQSVSFADANPPQKSVSLTVTDNYGASPGRQCFVVKQVPMRVGGGIPKWFEEAPAE